MVAYISQSCTGYFYSAAFSFLLSNATSNSGEPSGDVCCDRTAPMAQSDASVFSTKGRSNRGNYKIDAVVNSVLRAVNADSYTSVHTHAYSLYNRSNKGAESFA